MSVGSDFVAALKPAFSQIAPALLPAVTTVVTPIVTEVGAEIAKSLSVADPATVAKIQAAVSATFDAGMAVASLKLSAVAKA